MPKRIPSDVIKKWGQLKHDLLGAIDGMKDPMITKEFKKETKKKVESLYGEFDSGLSAKLKKGSTTKSDEEAVTEITKARTIAKTYLATVKKKKAEWGTEGNAVVVKFTKALENIIAACDAALD